MSKVGVGVAVVIQVANINNIANVTGNIKAESLKISSVMPQKETNY
jgi:hypothetical protein